MGASPVVRQQQLLGVLLPNEFANGIESESEPKIWTIRDVTTSDHNYDMGSLYIESNGAWHIIAPTGTGPQAYNTGGDLSAWISCDQGKHWQLEQKLTQNSPRNHCYPRRPVRAHDGFYALWADGNGRNPSASFLHFSTKAGQVFRLPENMDGPTATPEPVKPKHLVRP